MQPLPEPMPQLQRLFAGCTEQVFFSELGITDPNLTDYVARLLTRFIHRDAIYAVRDDAGRCLQHPEEMFRRAEQPDLHAADRREIFRHIGDFTLFWAGVYPERLRPRHTNSTDEVVLHYQEHGKRSYFLASTYRDTPQQELEAPVLRLLSDEYEMCLIGLRQVRDYLQEVA